MTRTLYGPFSRVEGHLEIELDRTDTQVTSARVNSPMFRGMETVMVNRAPMDALTIAPRICGICSVSQSVAAAKVLANLSGVEAPINGQLITNLILACEVLSNHLTHFYMFFMPDFARDIYQGRSWFDDAKRFKAETGPAQAEMLEARTRLLHIMGVLAGKWPHTLTIRPGGTTQTIKTAEKLKLKSILRGFRRFLEQSVFNGTLEDVMKLSAFDDIKDGDLGTFLKASKDIGLNEIGKTKSGLISGGGFDGIDGPLFQQGLYKDQQLQPLPVDDIREDITHSFMGGQMIQMPFEGSTDPFLDKADAYSWCKAPRLDGARCEVGALARHVVNGHDLFKASYDQNASTVENRIFARVWEMAELVIEMESWVDQINPDGEFFVETNFPREGQAFGFVEAARGTLGHWMTIEYDVISNYQIIAPTTWNFSPRDHMDQTGPLENALENTPIHNGEDDPVNVQHIVRSFDPCMACTVH
ncbi:nickel-dependent hydrogenase large subunit [Terasakiella sp. A23]|uniref:nickel-dependent hydrogenase large subunit n=1 Tax=Terasakiella sp. FCG-A23 TaxID=3080561 RepID=UPI002955410D|nr:nickel-dependent hydrogenase large subunit [Terasakiella sp. A23]MDV7338307.1 nickel-dependent hydrogenase large subunit [Terasakiella sp. A23]